MRIINLKAENIKKLVAVEITPKGDVVKITGKNGAGKTSVLDAIYWALAGQDNIQSQPIRKGQKEASVQIDLGDMIVERKFTAKNSYLSVKNKQGLSFPSPQKMLDDLIGRLTFDPLEFQRKDAKQQLAILRELTGVDTTELDHNRATIFEERRIKNREISSLASRINAIPVDQTAPEEEQSSREIVEKINAANTMIRARDEINNKIANFRTWALNCQDDRARVAEELKNFERETLRQIATLTETLKKRRADTAAELDKLEKTGMHHEQEADALIKDLPGDIPDIAGLQASLSELEVRNKAARFRKERKSLEQQLHGLSKEADDLTAELLTIDEQKLEKISKANFPLEGLGFGEGGVVYKDLPLDQASEAEKLRVSMAMAMAMNPKLRVIRITDGSLLDSNSLKIIEEMAKGDNFQVWVEMVDESGKIGIVIEDGQVAATNDS